MMCKRLAQVPMLCVPIYNMKLAMMQKTPIFTTFSAHTKMAADKRGQNEVFARNITKPSVLNGAHHGAFMFWSPILRSPVVLPNCGMSHEIPSSNGAEFMAPMHSTGLHSGGYFISFHIHAGKRGLPLHPIYCISHLYMYIYIYRYFIYIPIPTYVLCTSLYPTILYIYIPIQGGAPVFNCFKKMSLELEMYLPLKYSWAFETNAI